VFYASQALLCHLIISQSGISTTPPVTKASGPVTVTLEPPPPPLRQRLDQEGSFEATGPQETVPEPAPRGDFLAPEESIISDLETEGFRPTNPLITDLSAPILIQIVPPEVTSSEHQLVL
jgi:hypothetical protein